VIREAVPDERRQVVEALAEGFYDDPLMTWMLPDDARRLEQIERSFDLWTRRLYFPRGAVYTTDDFAGGACWLAPHGHKVGVAEQLRETPALVAIFRRDLGRAVALQNAMEKSHPREPHWYLPLIAVRPEQQGRGLGSALLRPMLERCDADGLPAYLEASTPRNRALYERHGFVVTGELRVRDAPPLWPMWRDPQPDGASSASTA